MPTLTHPDGRSKIVHASATRRIEALEAAGFVLEKDAPKRKATKSAAATPTKKTSSPEATPNPESLED